MVIQSSFNEGLRELTLFAGAATAFRILSEGIA